MDTKKLGQLALVVLGLLVGIYATVSILHNPTGGISGLSKLITITGVILGLVNPRAGLFFFAAQVMYSDEIKRLAVYYGVTSQLTISEVLVGPLLSLCAINASFLYGVLRGHYSLGKLGWALYALVPIFAAGSLLSSSNAGGGRMMVIYGTATFALYVTLIPLCYGLFRSFEEWVKFISWQALLAAPSAAWGIWQYYNGFNQMEWTYALSGLSPAHSAAMLGSPEPRIFGLFGTSAALGCVGMYCVLCLWRAMRYKKHRWTFLMLAVLFAATAVASQQRGTLVYPFIALGAGWFFRRKLTTVFIYGILTTTFLLAILNANWLLNVGIEKGNALIAMEGKWGSTLTFNTLSDRLRGWERLGRADSWSLFGTEKSVFSGNVGFDVNSSDYNHDSINKVLIEFGAIGLISALLFVIAILYILHKTVSDTADKQLRYDGALVMGCVIPAIILAATMGDNLNVIVISMQLWTVFSGIFVVRRLAEEKRVASGQLVPVTTRPMPSSPAMPRRLNRPV